MSLSRNKIFLIVACVICFGSIIFALEATNVKESYVSENNEEEIAFANRSIEEIDTDNDGLKNWQETLWKTDTERADTDGDGTNDGEEVNAGRDPLIKGPKDKIDNSTPAKQTEAKKLTATETFSREFYAEYLAAQKAGKPINDETYKKIVSDTLARHPNVIEAKVYNLSELSIFSIEDTASIKKYGNDMASIIKRHSPPNIENELIIVNRAINSNNADELKKIDPIINGYKNIVADLSKMKVPQSAAIDHLSFLNSTSLILETIESMRNTYTDPLSALIAIRSYSDNTKKLTASFTRMKLYFREKGVTFAQIDDGSMWESEI